MVPAPPPRRRRSQLPRVRGPPAPQGARARPQAPAAPGAANPAPGAANHGHGKAVLPGFSGGGHGQVVSVDYPRPAAPPPLDPPPPPAPTDAFSGIAPDVDLISIRQFSQAFGLKDAYTGDEDPQTRQKRDNIRTMARAIVHAANMGARVINISQVMCMSARSIIDQPDLGAAVRYAAVDKDAVIVVAAGDTSQRDCKENPIVDPLHPSDARDWNGVTTVVTPSWFSDYVLTVGAVDSSGTPMDKLSVAGPWVSIGAPGTDVVGLSPRDDSLVNAIDGPDNSLLVPSGTSFSTAIVSGVAALVRAKYPQLSSHQIINRLIHTARAPARGVDNQVGYGVVDPVAALTWDVPDGSVLPKDSASPLKLPPPPAPRNMAPVWVAAGGLGGALLLAGLVFGGAVLMRKNRETGMKAQREYGLNLSWARVTTVFLIDVALLVIASHLPDAWQAGRNVAFWVGVGLAVVVTARRPAHQWGSAHRVGPDCAGPELVRRPGGAHRRLHPGDRSPSSIQPRHGRST